jgi:hypothetical protein
MRQPMGVFRRRGLLIGSRVLAGSTLSPRDVLPNSLVARRLSDPRLRSRCFDRVPVTSKAPLRLV